MINGRTQLIGLIGWPVAHSFSPAMHNATAAAAGLDCVYVPLPVRPEDVVTAVHDAAELRVREVDPINVLAGELSKMAVSMTEHPDGFTIMGPVRPYSAEVDSHDDHRLGMALAVAGLLTLGETLVHDADCVSNSFPGFVETMQALGVRMEWVA